MVNARRPLKLHPYQRAGTFKSGETYKAGNTKLICTVVVARVDVQVR